MELILSYDNKQHIIRKELLFNYNYNNPVHNFMFQYQRDGVILDIRTYEYLVAMSKNAARYSLFEIPFEIDKCQKETNTKELARSYIYKVPYSTLYIENKNNFLYKSKKSIIRLNPIFGDIIFNRHLNILENLYLKTETGNTYKGKLNVFKNYFFGSNLNITNPYKSYMIKPKYNITTNVFNLIATDKKFYVDLLKSYFASYKTKNVSINNKITIRKYPFKYKINFIHDIFLKSHIDYDINLLDSHYNFKIDYYTLNIYEYFNLYNTNNFILNLYENTNIHKNPNSKLKTISENRLSYKKEHRLNVLEYLNTSKEGNYNIFYNDDINLLPGNKNIELFLGNDLLTSNNKRLYFKDNLLFKVKSKYLHTQRLEYSANKYNNFKLQILENVLLFSDAKNLYYDYRNILGSKDNNFLYTDNDNIFLKKFNNNAFVIKDSMSSSHIKSLYSLYNKDFTKKDKNFIDVNNYLFVSKDLLFTYIYDVNNDINKYNNDLFVTDGLFTINFNKNVSILSNNLYVNKYNSNLFVSSNLFINKNKILTYLEKHYALIDGFDKIASYEELNKIVDFNLNSKKIFLPKNIQFTKSKMYIDKYNELSMLIKSCKFLKEISKYIGFYKENKKLYFTQENINNIIKYALNTNILNGNNDCIISVNKYGQNIFENHIIDFFTKEKYNAFTLSNITASKVSFILDVNNDYILADILSKNVFFVDFFKNGITKSKIITNYYNNDIFLTQKHRNINFKEDFMNLIKSFYKLNHFDSFVNLFIKHRNIFIYDQYNAYKSKYDISILNPILFIKKKLTDISFIKNTDWLSKIIPITLFEKLSELDITKHIYISLNYIDIFRKNQNMSLFNDMDKANQIKNVYMSNIDSFNRFNKNIDIYNKIENIKRRSDFTLSIFNSLHIARPFLSLNYIHPDFEELSKVIVEAEITSDPIVDWAWVYEEEEGFDDPFKIDELLLPENDSRYEDFENLIFDKEKLKPRNFIKKIDDYTFIAKLPIKYPIKDENQENAYKDIAVEYLDVRTGIMRQVFIGYYKLWQDHIFDFAKMTMQQASKKILDYLYTWILMYFPLEDIPEALRTFRLVRWYLERSIIQNSEYIISYNPGDLESGMLDSSVSNIPSDINPTNPYTGEPQNVTMYIDTTKHIIRNHEDFLNQEAHITFYIENKKETKISFYLHTITPVNIILNGEVIDTISLPTTGKMVYNIPYTEDFNSFTIQKTALNNINTSFYIGNITIYGIGISGDLDIKFNPKLQGNMLLDNVSQKIISYINLYEDNDELMKNLVNGNIHLDQLYNDLLTYWELHHQEKDKGKRLTIKRT